MWRKTRKIHMIGIGGSGMSGIAELLLKLGFKVSGSDLVDSETVRYLKKLGADIKLGHRAENLDAADVVVYSSAVPLDNPEIKEARKRNIPVIPRAEMLAELLRLKEGIAVAGTHGKSTTTSMISQVLVEGGLDPTVVVGGRFKNMGSGARQGNGKYMVVEADESDGSFLKLHPVLIVVTNIDADHLDFYQSEESIKEAFLEFINKTPFYGRAFLCISDAGIKEIISKVEKPFLTYGINEGDFQARNIKLHLLGSEYDLFYKNKDQGKIKLSVPGVHNILNSLAAVAVGYELDVPFETIAQALAGFKGVSRRFDIKGEKNGVLVIDDYGHHPTEIKATLSAAKKLAVERGGKLIVLFQPHRYTRTYYIGHLFGDGFVDADMVFVTDIYPAGEKPIEGVSAQIIVDSIKSKNIPVEYVPELEEMAKKAVKVARRGDVIVVQGAGSVTKLAPLITSLL